MNIEPMNSTTLTALVASLDNQTITTTVAATLSTVATSLLTTLLTTPHPEKLCTCAPETHAPPPTTTITSTTTTTAPTTTTATTTLEVTTTILANLTTALADAAHHADAFNRPSPTNCIILKFISLYCLVLMCTSVTFNGALTFVFFKYKELRTPLNVMILVLTLLNLVGSCTELPFVITSNFLCRWPFGKIGCHVSGVIMYTIGCASIFVMIAISFERFFIIYKPLSIKTINHSTVLGASAICLVCGLFWAAAPAFGWSYYSLEGALTTCSVEWAERSWNVISYNIAIFIFVFAVPVVMIVGSNLKLVLIIKSMPNMMAKGGKLDPAAKKRIDREKMLTKCMVVLVTGFMISWTPYALVSLYAAFISSDISPLFTLLPSMFAKSSMLWSALFYILTNNQFKSKVFKHLGIKMADGTKKHPEVVSESRNKTVEKTNDEVV